METVDIAMEKLDLYSIQDESSEKDILIDTNDYITVTNKYDLINLVQDYLYPSKMLVEKVGDISTLGIFDREVNIDLTEVNFNNIL